MNKFFTKINLLVILLFILLLSNSCKKDSTTNNTTPIQNSGIIFNTNLIYGKMTDIDGNVYKTITIGNQTWMAENLRVTKYRNGDLIPNIIDTATWSAAWSNLTTGAYCNYNNDPNNSITYGRLYNWYVIKDPRNVAPLGWHIPSEDEWKQLSNFLGGDNVSGGKLKEISATHWYSPNEGASNSSGFTSLPSGYRSELGPYYNINKTFICWNTREFPIAPNQAGEIQISYIYSKITIGAGIKNEGMAIRCIKD